MLEENGMKRNQAVKTASSHSRPSYIFYSNEVDNTISSSQTSSDPHSSHDTTPSADEAGISSCRSGSSGRG